MGNKSGKKVAVALAVGAIILTSGCSTLKDYTFNGIPIDSLYAKSDGVATDANVDGEGFCVIHKGFCLMVGAAVGITILEIVESTTNGNGAAPAAPAAPAVQLR